MNRIIRQIGLHVLATIFALLLGCGPKVMVPPKIDLQVYENVGMIEFTSNAKGNLQQFVTLKFLEKIQSAQPGLHVLELGTKESVLNSVQYDQLDFKALQKIGKDYNVDAIIMGHLDITDVKPKVHLSTLITSMHVQAEVEAALSAKLFETGNGATLWTNSTRGKETVANVTMIANGPAHFDARDPENAYGKLAEGLVKKITKDFRVRYVRK